MVQLASRYYSVLYPALLLLAAIGVDGLASTAGRISRALWANHSGNRPVSVVRRPDFSATLVFAALALFLFSRAVPALANSYAIPKPDYRGADLLIESGAANQADTVVLALGMGTVTFFPESLQYYFDLWGSAIIVEDGRGAGYDAATRLMHGNGAVWGVVYQGLSPDQMTSAKNAGFKVLPVAGMTLLKPTAGTPIQEAEDLLRWGSAGEPRLLPSIDLLQAVSGALSEGPNQLDPPAKATVPAQGVTLLGPAEPADHWNLWPGTSLTPDGTAFHLVTNQQTVNLTWVTSRVAPGGKYALLFRCRNGDLVGDQHVYVSAHSPDGDWLDTFPSGLGYLCPKSTGWTAQGFAFHIPTGANQIRIWLRITGEGSAAFSDVELRELR